MQTHRWHFRLGLAVVRTSLLFVSTLMGLQHASAEDARPLITISSEEHVVSFAQQTPKCDLVLLMEDRLMVVDVARNKISVRKLPSRPPKADAVGVSPDGTMCILLSNKDDSDTTTYVQRLTGDDKETKCLTDVLTMGWEFSPSSKKLVAKTRNGCLKLWDTGTGKELASVEAKDQLPALMTSAGFSKDEKRVVITGLVEDGVVWDTSTGEVRKWSIDGHVVMEASFGQDADGAVVAAVIAHEGSLFRGRTEHVFLVSFGEKTKVRRVSGLEEGPDAVALSPDGELMTIVTSGVTSGHVRFWDCVHEKFVGEIDTKQRHVCQVRLVE